MPQLILSDSKLVFLDLLSSAERQKMLLQTRAWGLYEEPCRNMLADIQALPPAVVDAGRPLADRLASVDLRHDGWGGFIISITDAYRAHPDLDAEIVHVLDVVRDHVIASRKELTASYPSEAARAMDRAPLLPKLKADLKLIPLAGSKAKNLFEAVQIFTDAGVELNALLSDRGTQEANVKSRAAAMTLRASAQGLLTELRGALATEIRHSKGRLPASLDGAIFGYLDVLLKAQADRDTAAAAAVKTAQAKAADKAAAGGTLDDNNKK